MTDVRVDGSIDGQINRDIDMIVECVHIRHSYETSFVTYLRITDSHTYTNAYINTHTHTHTDKHLTIAQCDINTDFFKTSTSCIRQQRLLQE